MSETSVAIAMKRISVAENKSRIAVFTNPAKPWLLDVVFDSTIETRKAIRAGFSRDGGKWVGSFCRDDFQEAVKRLLQATVTPKPIAGLDI